MTKKRTARRPRTNAEGLTAKQARFVAEYLVDHNATQAAIRAGYSRKTANEQGARLLANVSVAAAVETRERKVADKLEITSDRIAAELAKLGFSNMADYMKVTSGGDPYLDLSGLSRDQSAALTEVTVDDYLEGRGEDAREVKRVRVKLADKRAALVDLAKLCGFWKERHELGAGESLLELLTPKSKG